MQASVAYLLHKLSYSRFFCWKSQFSVENPKFSLPWQQGYVRAKCDWHSWIGRPRKPYSRTKNCDSILYKTEVMANFLVKFPIFRYDGNRGRLSKVKLTPLNWPIPKTSGRCKHRWRISCTSWVIADFLLKIANFRCHGNKGMSEPNVTGIVELGDPENHTIEPKITTPSYIQPKLWRIFR